MHPHTPVCPAIIALNRLLLTSRFNPAFRQLTK